MANKKTQKHSTQLSVGTIENASETTALANLATDLQTYLTNTFFDDVMHFDTADTISANITVTKIERTRTESNDLKPGSEVYEIDFTLDWNY